MGLVGPVSVYCDWVRWKVWSATSILASTCRSVPEIHSHVVGTLSKQATNQPTQLQKRVVYPFEPNSKGRHSSSLTFLLTGYVSDGGRPIFLIPDRPLRYIRPGQESVKCQVCNDSGDSTRTSPAGRARFAMTVVTPPRTSPAGRARFAMTVVTPPGTSPAGRARFAMTVLTPPGTSPTGRARFAMTVVTPRTSPTGRARFAMTVMTPPGTSPAGRARFDPWSAAPEADT